MDDPVQSIQGMVSLIGNCDGTDARIIVMEDLDSIIPVKVEVSEQTEMTRDICSSIGSTCIR